MYFNYRQRGIASVTSVKVRGEPGIGSPVLSLAIAVMMQPAIAARPDNGKPPPVIAAMHGRLSIANVLLAPLEVEFLEWHCVDHAQQNNVVLRAFLSPGHVRAIDALRSADGGFDLEIALVAQIRGNEGLLPVPYSSTPLRERVTASDWTRILTEMRFEDRATFEVPIEGGRVGPPLDKAAGHMRAALDRLQQRQWDDALTKCREVLTELQPFLLVPPPAWPDWADPAERTG
jgi:hypothetical protein